MSTGFLGAGDSRQLLIRAERQREKQLANLNIGLEKAKYLTQQEHLKFERAKKHDEEEHKRLEEALAREAAEHQKYEHAVEQGHDKDVHWCRTTRVFPDMSARSACLQPNVSADMSADMSARLVWLSTDADIFHKLYS